jgi:hypothetical protein
MNDDLPHPEPVYIDVEVGPTTLCINLDMMGEKGFKIELICNEKKFIFTKDQILKYLNYIQKGFYE